MIAARTDDLFAPGTDVSLMSFTLRDRYTDLMWLGGTRALWDMGDGMTAAPLFQRYGDTAKTPLTKRTSRSRDLAITALSTNVLILICYHRLQMHGPSGTSS